MVKKLSIFIAGFGMLLGATAIPAHATPESVSAPSSNSGKIPCDKVKMCKGRTFEAAPRTGPTKDTPINPKIVKGKAGEGIFDPSATGYETSDPGFAEAKALRASKTNTKTANALTETFSPAPYSTLRWATTPEDANGHPWICIGNHTGDAFQDRVIAWDDAADQLTYSYQVSATGTHTACSGWGNNEKIDVEIGTDTARACAYVYKAWNSSGLLTRVIAYYNHAIAGCTSETNPTAQLSAHHWRSQVIGLGLGNLQYGSANNPGWYGVMDMSQYSYDFPDPVRNDGLTYDWYN